MPKDENPNGKPCKPHGFDYDRPKLPNLLDILEGDGGKIK